jgi:N-acetylneuraminate synthase/N,N'-diacetyllegionaminate synthase
MKIGHRQIGDSAPVYIIAELGVNHDGSLARALEMTDAAAEAGADAIKLQLFRADLLMSRAARLASYQAEAGESDPHAMLRRLELSIGDMGQIVDRAHARGIHAIVTPFSADLVDSAERLGVGGFDAYKTASPDIIHKPLLDRLVGTQKPFIVSTGAASTDEVERAARWLVPAKDRIALLQCVSSYPTPPENANIRAMHALTRIWRGPIGYSDHTTAVDTGALAATQGAAILEKHFTYDKDAPGPDHAASLEPAEFRAYATLAREESTMLEWIGDSSGAVLSAAADFAVPRDRAPSFPDPRLGDGEKRVLPCEQDVRRLSRQSIVTRRDLPAGHTLTADDLTIKRPGTGIEPWRLPELPGRRLRRPAEADTPITSSDIEGLEGSGEAA